MKTKEIRTIIGIIGNVTSFFISISYMPKFIELYKKKTVEDFQQHRHVGMVMKCSMLVLYGLPLVQKDSILVTTSNGVCLVIEVIYVVVFFIYCDSKPRMDGTVLVVTTEVGLLVTLSCYTLWWLEPFSARRRFIGVVCNVYTIIMHGSLALTKIMGPGRATYMPFWLSLVNFINVGIWTAYSLIYKIDIYLLVISGLGTLAYVCLSNNTRVLLKEWSMLVTTQ